MRGAVTARAQALLQRIHDLDATLRCYVAVDRVRVLEDARALDALPPHARAPLHGWTLAVKDIIDVAGLPTRAGSAFFHREPAADAPVVAALRAAGALVIGKTNTHEFAWGVTTENPHFGRTANPWDHTRSAGGSSGGSGAAVAAGLADIALGSDTLGSIRIPAALNGISGLRPATGTLSSEGLYPLAPGLDTAGPFARDLERVQRVYEVLAGRSAAVPLPRRVCRLRGGGWDRVEPGVVRALDAAAAVLRASGISVEDVQWWDEQVGAAVGIVQQHAAAAVHREQFAEHKASYGDDVRARIERALTVSDDDLARARAVVETARASWQAATAGFAAALAPSVGCEAPPAPVAARFRDETIPLVTPASIFGLPAAAVPIGSGEAGLPLGMQIIAVDGAAGSALAVGRRYQELTEWHQRLPPVVSSV